MGANENELGNGTSPVADTLKASLVALSEEARQLQMLRSDLFQVAEQELALHREMLETIRLMRREMERMQRALRALSVSR